MIDFAKGLKILREVIGNGKTHEDYQHVTELADKYKILITGKDMEKLLIQFTRREDIEAFEQRVRLTQEITPAICEKIMTPFYKIGRLDNVNKVIEHENENVKNSILNNLSEYFGDSGLTYYLNNRFTELTFSDPNAFIVTEFDADGQSYPMEVSSHEAVDYKVKRNILKYLVVKQQIEYLDAKNSKRKGYKYCLYTKDFQVVLEQVKKQNVTSELNTDIEQDAVISIDSKYYRINIFEPKLDKIQAYRVGYKRDLATDGRTFVSPLHSALPRMMKSIKSVSEMDLSISLHAFPQKIQYVEKCDGTHEKPCRGGKCHDGTTCQVCNGTGFKVHTSAQDVIEVPMPKDKEDMFDLNGLIAYKSPDISLLTFLKEYTKELEDDCLKDVFSTDVFTKLGSVNTATEKVIDMQSVYDTLQPFADKYSKSYLYTVEVVSNYQGVANLVTIHKFPKDFKLKTVNNLLSELKTAQESNAPLFLINELSDDIAMQIYSDSEVQLQRHVIKSEHEPFKGKSSQDIQYIISAGLTTRENEILWANFDSIFTELEKDSLNTNTNFYDLSFERRNELIDEKVREYITKADNNSSIGESANFGTDVIESDEDEDLEDDQDDLEDDTEQD